MADGRLILVATPIGNLGDMSPRAIDALQGADVVACEDTRRSGRLLAHFGIRVPRLLAIHEHNEFEKADYVVQLLGEGQVVAVITDAGMPGISDPGERLVAAVTTAGFEVEVIPGPVAFVGALVASGISATRFVFEGFLPRKGAGRTERLAALRAEQRTMVLYEAPHRLAATLSDLATVLGDGRQVSVARELTKMHEETWRGTLAEAVERCITVEPRGEYVLTIAGAPDAAPATDDILIEALARYRKDGLSKRDATDVVTAEYQVARRRVYDLANTSA